MGERRKHKAHLAVLHGITGGRLRAMGVALACFALLSSANCRKSEAGWDFWPFTSLVPLVAGSGNWLSALAPEGVDSLSISTNFSRKVEDPQTKETGLAAAAFIKPPAPNNYGAVSLSYPLEVPAGRGGLTPQLGLSYSSNGGDGIVGIGWSIGLGAISRTTRYGQLYYDERDVFTFNGKRLVRVSGPAGSEEGEYRLEIESGFKRLELTDIASGGVWRVYDTDGGVSVYGATQNSRIYHPDQPNLTYSWQMSGMEDRNGNTMEVYYDDSDYATHRILYLQEIRYAGNPGAGQAARQYVRFYTRKRDDAYVSKAAGFVMRMDRLLERVEMGWDMGVLWDYRLIYETSPDSGRPLLKTVDSSRTATRPEFHYQPAEHNFIWQKVKNINSSDPEVNPEATRYFEGDFNGDGISDLLFFNPESGYWKAAEGRREGGYNYKTYGYKFRGYDGPEKIQFFKGNVTGDYNGDGRSDIAMYLPATREFWVAEHDGRVFQFRGYGRLPYAGLDIFKAEWFPGDYDGNGLSDAVLFDEQTGDWTLMRNMGGRFEFLKFSHIFHHLFRDDYRPDADLNSPVTTDNSAAGKSRSQIIWLNGDYNGDGRTDISFYDARNGQWWVGENYRVKLAPGFQLQWKLYQVFTAPEQVLFGHDRFSGDFNGDGYSDFMFFDRSSGDWILGETGDKTISFRIFSSVPEFKNITRWLQGDFNGDGRTDIGFYSQDDNNFWVGEATSHGFRYRIYNNLSYGPDPAQVMATPLPLDEVKISQGQAAFTLEAGKTILLEYQYDANNNPDRGEEIFAGCFSIYPCATSPEMLIYKRRENRLEIKRGDGAPAPALLDLDLDGEGWEALREGRPGRFSRADRDEVLLYRKTTPLFGTNTHTFNVLTHNLGDSFQEMTWAEFDEGSVVNFNIQESLHLSDHFESPGYKSLLVLDDQADTARFLFAHSDGTATPLILGTGALSATDFKHIFRAETSNDRWNRKQYSFFSGDFTGSGRAQVLLVDRRSATHLWYLGSLVTDLGVTTITFVQLSGNPSMALNAVSYNSAASAAGVFYYTRPDGDVVYADQKTGSLLFNKLTVSASSITQTVYEPGPGTSYRNQFDHNGNPLIQTAAGPRVYDISSGAVVALDPAQHLQRELKRPDLLTEVYPFRWIQGDYNGDGKTDIGIFHLKESEWYFANTTGTVPDLMQKVKNGIGGTYTLEYQNSTLFDNTGGDTIPDLPVNYKVCTRIDQDDGRGNRITFNYEYKNGYAFSAFINGRKETDYFGFGEFTMRDAYNGRSISRYHNTPYADYRQNRALAGAIKEKLFLGYDNKQYSRTLYEYQLHEINQGGIQTGSSYLVTPALVRKYVQGTLTETRTRAVMLAPAAYELQSSAESVTDHYSDAAHAQTTISEYSQFETIAATNQQRPTLERKFDATSHELTLTYLYDGNGNVSRQTTTPSGTGLLAAAPRIAEFSYDAYGNVTEERDVSTTPTRIKRRSYDTELHQFVVQETNVADSGDLVTSYVINYGSAFGAPDSVTGPNGKSRYSDYDGYGRIIRLRADAPDATVATLQEYSYSSALPLSAKTTFYTGTADPAVKFRSYTDGLGRLIQRVRSAPDGKYVRSGRIVYDALGRVTRQSRGDWADAGEIETFKVNLTEREPTVTQYDASGRVWRVTLPRAAGETQETLITTIYNDPWEVVTSHSGGTSKRKVKNVRGQILYVEDSGTGDDAAAVNAQIGFCYDIAGNRTKKMDLNGSVLSCSDAGGSTLPPKDSSGNSIAYWIYDALGQIRGESDPDLGVSSYTYNAFGDAITQTDALSRVTNMSYDRLGRMVVKTLPGTEGVVTYTYDVNAGSANAKGRLAVMDDPAQTKVFSYDELGRISKETRTIKQHNTPETNVPYITVYRYDLLNRTREIDYPQTPGSLTAGARACYNYNAMGYARKIAVRLDSSAGGGCADEKIIISSMTYNEFGQVSQVSRGNGVTANYTYDVKGRLIRLVDSGTVGGESKNIQDIDYTFDVKNNVKEIVNNATDYQTTYNYAYDGLNRLVSADGSYVETDDGTGTAQTVPSRFKRAYGYAQNGNLTNKDFLDPETSTLTDRWSYTYSNHMVTNIDSTLDGVGRFTMVYNAVGNMTDQQDGKTGQQKEIYFNSQNRITHVINPVTSQTVGSYEYDDQGFRVRKVSLEDRGSGVYEVETIYPSRFYGLEVKDATISSVNNIYLNGLRIAALAPNGAAVWFTADQVDSVKIMLDEAANTVTRTEFMPYGETFVHKGEQSVAPKYNSQEKDRETGYYFYNARYYDPEIARFVTADSVIDGEFDTQGWNRYMYTKGNPIIWKDPTGHRRFKIVDYQENDHSGDKKEVRDYFLVEEKYDKGKGIVQIAEQILMQDGKQRTKESVRATVNDIMKKNPDLFNRKTNPNLIVKHGDLLKLGSKTTNETRRDLSDAFPATVKMGSKAAKGVLWAVKKIFGKADDSQETDEVSSDEELMSIIRKNEKTISNDIKHILKAAGIKRLRPSDTTIQRTIDNTYESITGIKPSNMYHNQDGNLAIDILNGGFDDELHIYQNVREYDK